MKFSLPACALFVAGACGTEAPAPAIDAGVSPPHAYVYAGGGTTIDVFRADLATGALAFQATVPAGDSAYLVDADVRRGRVYLQTQLGLPVIIRAFDVESADGMLRPASDYPLPHPFVEGMTEILLDPTGRWFLMSSTGGATGLLDQLLPVAADGTLGAARTISSDFYGFAWDPAGRFLYGLDGVAINQYRFDGEQGGITANMPAQAEGSMGHQILGLRHHPGGRWAYSVEEGAIGIFAFDPAAGTLVGQGYARNVVPGDAVTWSSLVIHPGGRQLYVVGSVSGTQLLLVDQFSIDPASGSLTFVRREQGDERHRLQLGSLQAPLLLGDLLIVGGQGLGGPLEGAPALCVYRLDPVTGGLMAAGDLVSLQPAASTPVNFIFGISLGK
jgi:6-phosphogluconolactonase (cycloisomerase 2 family)